MTNRWFGEVMGVWVTELNRNCLGEWRAGLGQEDAVDYFRAEARSGSGCVRRVGDGGGGNGHPRWLRRLSRRGARRFRGRVRVAERTGFEVENLGLCRLTLDI